MNDISPKDIWGYQTKRKQDGVKPVTINRELAFLSTAINFANRHWEWDLSNPVKGRKLRNVGSARTRWLTRDQANRLLEAASSEPKAPHLSDFIRLALYTGARRGELLGLEWSRVDLRADLIHLEAVHTKTGTPRTIPLCKEARQALIGRQRFRASFCPDAPFVFVNRDGCPIRSIKRSFSTAYRRAAISNFRIHDLRHTFASWCVTDGTPLLDVRQLLGHSTIKMTERYAHLAVRQRRGF
jgi:integrase